jgi:hypothetical protein
MSTQRKAASADALLERIHTWLLDSALHPLPAGAGGSRCGVLGQTGPEAYLYPEIAGYYLNWLARQAGEHGELALRIIRWLVDWSAAAAPPARVALTPAPDWRSAGLFAFDLAMLRRGCACWPDLAMTSTLAGRIDGLLERLLDADGRIRPVLADGFLPQRWSTTAGAYQAKVAVALLASESVFPLPSRLVTATRRMADEACRMPPHAEHHPELYAIEGLLVLDPSRAAQRLARLLDRIDAEAWLREKSDGGRRRTDVQAQAIRAARWLALDDERTDRMARRLAAAVRADGSLRFDPDDKDAPANTWCALFAAEALAASPANDCGMPT